MDNPITRAEHNEFVKRIDEEHSRTNQRLKNLEELTKQMTDIAVSVKELAISVKQMAETQRVQGEKLEELEGRDGEMWRKISSYVLTAIIGAIVCFVLTHIGL